MIKKSIAILIPYKKIENCFYVWMQTRDSLDELNGLLEFPGGKVEEDESTLEAVVRETKEETGVNLPSEEVYFYKQHENPVKDKIIQLNIFLFNDDANLFNGAGWQRLNTEEDLDLFVGRIPPANEIFLRKFLNSNKFKMLVAI